MAEISVIVPVYKVEQYLHRCIDSILNQTFSDFELILVDDGSPDNCGKICDSYAEKDCRINVIHKKNGGLSDARNVGLEWALANSNSNWIMFIDSDDWIHPMMLHKLLDANIENDSNISCCSFERTSGKEPDIDINTIKTYITTPEKFYLENNVTATIACAKLYNKECLKTIRYPIGRLHEDEFTTYKILFACDKISYIDAPFYMYYQNENSITSLWNPKRLDAIDAYKEQIKFFNQRNLSNIETQQCTCMMRFLSTNFVSLKNSSLPLQKKLKYSIKIKYELFMLLKTVKKFNLTTDEIEWHIGNVCPVFIRIYSYIKKFNFINRGKFNA